MPRVGKKTLHTYYNRYKSNKVKKFLSSQSSSSSTNESYLSQTNLNQKKETASDSGKESERVDNLAAFKKRLRERVLSGIENWKNKSTNNAKKEPSFLTAEIDPK